MSTRFADDLCNLLVLAMAFDVHKECVVPVDFATGTFFDVSQINRISFEDAQHIHQRARSMIGREHDGRFIVA